MTRKPYYPIFLDLQSQPCLVVGGGSVAQRKVQTLLDCGAGVTVVSPASTPQLKDMAGAGRIRLHQREYASGDETGMRVVIAATDDQSVNESVARAARERSIPVNVVDVPDRCTFIMPAVAHRGDIQIAVSTGGGAPGIAARIRDEIESVIGDEYVVLVDELKEQRDRIKALGSGAKHEFWTGIRGLDLGIFRGKEHDLRGFVRGSIERCETGELSTTGENRE